MKILRMLRDYNSIGAGETAGFPDDVAAALLKRKMAVLVERVIPQAKAPSDPAASLRPSEQSEEGEAVPPPAEPAGAEMGATRMMTGHGKAKRR